MSSEDPAAPDTPTIDEAAGSRRSPTRPDDLVQFVSTKGTHITGRHKDKFERITETASDLELARRGPSPSANGPIRATRDVGLRPWPGRPQSF